jgi:hypothetical protein
MDWKKKIVIPFEFFAYATIGAAVAHMVVLVILLLPYTLYGMFPLLLAIGADLACLFWVHDLKSRAIEPLDFVSLCVWSVLLVVVLFIPIWLFFLTGELMRLQAALNWFLISSLVTLPQILAVISFLVRWSRSR